MKFKKIKHISENVNFFRKAYMSCIKKNTVTIKKYLGSSLFKRSLIHSNQEKSPIQR